MTTNLKFMNIQKFLLYYRQHKSQLTEAKKDEISRIFLKYNTRLVDFYDLDFIPLGLYNEFLDTKKLELLIHNLKISSDKCKDITKYLN